MEFVRDTIRTQRRIKNLTQAELAEKIGKKRPYISGIESGSQKVSVESANAILKALGWRCRIVCEPIEEEELEKD